MELLRANYINTTTAIVVNSNTTTAEYIMRPDTTFQHVSSGLNNDLTTATIRINFSETLSVSRIALVGINLKSMRIFYNGATANTFSLTTTGSTNSSYFTTNSETSLYLQANAVDCTSVSIDMINTQTADQEKAIGYLVISKERLDFARIPSASNYKPIFDTQDVVHRLSDGNTRIQTIAEKWRAEVKLEYISETMRNSLKTLWQVHDGMIFVPFGTTTSWDAIIFPCVWEGPFEFYRFSDNAPSAGFEGKLTLSETTP